MCNNNLMYAMYPNIKAHLSPPVLAIIPFEAIKGGFPFYFSR